MNGSVTAVVFCIVIGVGTFLWRCASGYDKGVLVGSVLSDTVGLMQEFLLLYDEYIQPWNDSTFFHLFLVKT